MSDNANILQEITNCTEALVRLRDVIQFRQRLTEEQRTLEYQVCASIASLRMHYEKIADSSDA